MIYETSEVVQHICMETFVVYLNAQSALRVIH